MKKVFVLNSIHSVVYHKFFFGKLFFLLLTFFLFLGCTEQDILLVRQSVGADVNGFFDGNFDGAIPFVDVNVIVFDKDLNFKNNVFSSPVIAGDLNWLYLSNYPSACPSGTAVSAIGDTLSCVALSDTNGFVTWLDANAVFVKIVDFNSYLNPQVCGVGYALQQLGSTPVCVELPVVNGFIPYQGATEDLNTGVYNIDTNFIYANVIWTDRNRGYGTMYCPDGNIFVGYVLGKVC